MEPKYDEDGFLIEGCEQDDYDYDDSMDGDWDSGMASAGYGTDEDYGYYGDEW
tara:strand:- start:194 stop:352 length:159 start_codon:yes stop_codon:yes gene_type:complete